MAKFLTKSELNIEDKIVINFTSFISQIKNMDNLILYLKDQKVLLPKSNDNNLITKYILSLFIGKSKIKYRIVSNENTKIENIQNINTSNPPQNVKITRAGPILVDLLKSDEPDHYYNNFIK